MASYSHSRLVVNSILLTLLLCLFACSRHSISEVQLAQAGALAVDPAAEAVLDGIEAEPAPAGIDGKLWQQLTAELARVVRENGTARTASTPPTRERDAVKDLHVVAGSSGATISWTHFCTGDYDLNSEVNISDLTPVGIYFGASASSWNWGEAQVADGDGNGEVNIADVTPIGLNFMVKVTSYSVCGSVDILDYPADPEAEDGPGTTAYAPVLFSAGTEGAAGKLVFTADVSTSVLGDYFWVRPNDGSTDGVPSNSTGAFARSDWWMEGRDLKHTRRSVYSGPRDNHIAWTYDCGDDIYGSPVVRGDGSIYVGCHDGNLNCITPDGNLDWNYLAPDGIWTTPAIGVDGTVYFGCRDDQLYAISPTGAYDWSIDLGSDVLSPAVGENGNIYVATSGGTLYSISSAGVEDWHFDLNGWMDCSPAIGDDGAIYIGDSAGNLFCVEPGGSQRWVFEADGEFTTSPSIGTSGAIYACNTSGYVYAISAAGTELWRYMVEGPLLTGVALGADGAIYCGGEFYYVHVLNPDGTLRWSYFCDDWMEATPTIAGDGMVYCGSDFGRFFAVNQDGCGHWFYDEGSSFQDNAVILPQGTLVTCTYGGMVYAFDGADGGTPASVNSLTPHDGYSGQDITIRANVLGTPQLTYSWDFGGGATPNTSSSPSPQITLGSPGEYSASVSVQNAIGDSIFPFTLVVYPESPGSDGWVHSIGGNLYDGFEDIVVLDDGSAWAVGYHEPGAAGGGDCLIAHYSAEGDLLDSWTWGLPGFDMLTEIQVAANGDLICAGEYSTASIANILLLRFTPAGDIVWQKGWECGNYSNATSLALGDDGSVYVLGTAYNANADIVGLVWDDAGVYGGGIYIDNETDYGGTLIVDGSDVYICGTTGNSPTWDFDILLLEIQLGGAIVWAKTLGTDEYVGAYGMGMDASGNLYVAGTGGGTICKFTSAGSLEWARIFATSNRMYYSGLAIEGMDIYVTGSEYVDDESDDIALLRLGLDGTLGVAQVWRAAYEDDYGEACFVGPSGDIYICGDAAHRYGAWETLPIVVNTFPGTLDDITPAKTDASGTEVELDGVLGDPDLVQDTGGGWDEAIIMRWNFGG